METFESVAMATETQSYFFQLQRLYTNIGKVFIVEGVMGLHVRRVDVNVVWTLVKAE